MRLNKLKSLISAFESYFKSDEANEWLWLYKKQIEFNQRLQSEPLTGLLEWIFSGAPNTRIWKRPQYEPKRMMLLLTAFDEDLVREAFIDLYDENLQIDTRIERFGFYMDDVLNRYRGSHVHTVETNHYQDASIISYYLCLQNPDVYSYYEPRKFEHLLEVLGAKYTKNIDDPVRFFKTSKIIYKFMSDNQHIKDIHLNRLLKSGVDNSSILIVSEFTNFCSNLDQSQV